MTHVGIFFTDHRPRGAYPQYAIVAIFLLAWSEAIPVLGTIVPGSTLIIAISALAAGADVSAIYLVLAAIAGAVAGDALSFWIGHRYHQAALLIWPLKRYPQLIERSKAFINKYGIASVFLARFTAVVRAFVPLVAVVVRMPSGKFYAANIASALLWGPLHVFPGVLAAFVLSILGAGRAQLPNHNYWCGSPVGGLRLHARVGAEDRTIVASKLGTMALSKAVDVALVGNVVAAWRGR